MDRLVRISPQVLPQKPPSHSVQLERSCDSLVGMTVRAVFVRSCNPCRTPTFHRILHLMAHHAGSLRRKSYGHLWNRKTSYEQNRHNHQSERELSPGLVPPFFSFLVFSRHGFVLLEVPECTHTLAVFPRPPRIECCGDGFCKLIHQATA